MFEKIRRQLLLSYLMVFGTLLAGFAIAVRVLFAHSLSQQVTARLYTLGQVASSSVELEQKQLNFKTDFPIQTLLAQEQGLQWFDIQGQTIARQGKRILNLPFVGKDVVQIQAGYPRIQGVTLSVIDSDNGSLVGYVRASQSLEEFDEAVRHLDWLTIGSIVIALGLSSVGGVWLTRQAMEPIEQSFEQLKQFTADASHELRSPLMAIGSNAQVALRYPEGMRSGDREKFTIIASTVKQLTHLTEDLLLLARTDLLPSQNQTTIQLDIVLTNLVQLYHPQASAKAITLTFTTTESLSTKGDENQLRRLFTNLINNALHYTPEGGRVELKGCIFSSELLISIQDTGIGIAPDQINHVFDRFWRAESSRHYQSGGFGLGLGLAIAQVIAQQHQGTISVTSEPENGSCFLVRLPAVMIKNASIL